MKVVFQPSICRGYVSFRECKSPSNTHHLGENCCLELFPSIVAKQIQVNGGRILWEQANKRFWDICSLDRTWTIDKESETLPVVRFCYSFVATCSDVYFFFNSLYVI